MMKRKPSRSKTPASRRGAAKEDTKPTARKTAAEARRKAEEEARQKAEEEAFHKAEEEARLEVAEKKRLEAEEKARLASEKKAQKATEEACPKADEEAPPKAEEETLSKADEKAGVPSEDETRKIVEGARQRKLEIGSALTAEEEACIKAEEDARLAEEEGHLTAKGESPPEGAEVTRIAASEKVHEVAKDEPPTTKADAKKDAEPVEEKNMKPADTDVGQKPDTGESNLSLDRAVSDRERASALLGETAVVGPTTPDADRPLIQGLFREVQDLQLAAEVESKRHQLVSGKVANIEAILEGSLKAELKGAREMAKTARDTALKATHQVLKIPKLRTELDEVKEQLAAANANIEDLLRASKNAADQRGILIERVNNIEDRQNREIPSLSRSDSGDRRLDPDPSPCWGSSPDVPRNLDACLEQGLLSDCFVPDHVRILNEQRDKRTMTETDKAGMRLFAKKFFDATLSGSLLQYEEYGACLKDVHILSQYKTFGQMEQRLQGVQTVWPGRGGKHPESQTIRVDHSGLVLFCQEILQYGVQYFPEKKVATANADLLMSFVLDKRTNYVSEDFKGVFGELLGFFMINVPAGHFDARKSAKMLAVPSAFPAPFQVTGSQCLLGHCTVSTTLRKSWTKRAYSVESAFYVLPASVKKRIQEKLNEMDESPSKKLKLTARSVGVGQPANDWRTRGQRALGAVQNRSRSGGAQHNTRSTFPTEKHTKEASGSRDQPRWMRPPPGTPAIPEAETEDIRDQKKAELQELDRQILEMEEKKKRIMKK